MRVDNGAVRAPRRGADHAGVTATVSLAAALLVAGCASPRSALTEIAAPTTATSAAGSAVEARAAAQYASNTAPAAAQMVCSDEIRGEVADALNLASVPAPASAWADHVYTCTYTPPMGRLVLSVTVAPSTAAAHDRLAVMRDQLGAGVEEPGMGQQAYSASNGTILAAKDNMVLRVDATALPDDLGATHQHRVDVARLLAAGVFNCWTGNG
jgi:hypothetical protein